MNLGLSRVRGRRILVTGKINAALQGSATSVQSPARDSGVAPAVAAPNLCVVAQRTIDKWHLKPVKVTYFDSLL